MKIDPKTLQEGQTTARFEIGVERLTEVLHEIDELYAARGEACVVDLTLDKFEDTIVVRGSIKAPIGYECARCLADQDRPLDIRLKWTLLPREAISEGLTPEEEVELSADDLDVSFYDADEEIDLEDLAREAILLDLDPGPRCPDDACANTLLTLSSAEPDGIDPRWAPLQNLASGPAGKAKNLKN